MFQDQVLKPSSLFKKSSKECKFIKARQLVDSFSTPHICRGLRISEFNYDFLGIRESVFGTSFFLTLDIKNDYFKSRKTIHKLHKCWANSIQANCDRRQGSWPSLSLSLEVAVYLHRRVLWPGIFLIFIVWMNWRTLQPTIFSVGVLKSHTGIRAIISHVFGSCALERRTVTTKQVQLGIRVRVQL